MWFAKLLVAMTMLVASAGTAQAEDGYDLWMRYRPLATSDAAAL